MLAVRYVALAALVCWVGGMLMFGAVVAPTIFRVLEAADPANGRLIAGTLVGTLLGQLHVLAYACGTVIGFGLLIMKFIGPPPRAFFARLGIIVVMLGFEIYSGGPLARELTEVRARVPGPIERLPPSDERRLAFDRLHATSTALMGINAALGLVLLFWYARE
jgi:hypothetical protein